MSIVHIGIGSNMGDREGNCLKAVELLKTEGVVVRKVSSMYETEPRGLKDQPLFINMAVEVKTGLSPRQLLAVLKAIEKQMGRAETVRWGPRVVDLDILLWEGIVIKEPGLEIPHPLMHEREFVLKPLSEIAPEAVHPALGRTVRELKEKAQ